MIGRKNASSKLRQRVTLQEETQTADGVGGYTRSWNDVAELWVEISPLNGKEKLFAMQRQSTVTHRVVLRFRDGIKASQRLMFDNRALYIQSISGLGKSAEFLELLVEEGALS